VDEEGDVEPWRRRVRRIRRQMPLWQEVPILLIVAFCLAILIRTFLLQAFFIPSGSMENTLLIGDRVLVNKVVYDVRTPQRGEVVVFRGTNRWLPQSTPAPNPSLISNIGRTLGDLVGISQPGEMDFIKRVIGLPGDRVKCCDAQGRVTVNGVPLNEPYVSQNSPLDVPPNPRECRSRRFGEVVVPPGQLFVMGDHRLVSLDSRCQGTVPISNVIGRAFVIVWPYARWSSLSVPSTFNNLPQSVAAPAAGTVSPANWDSSGGIAIVVPIVGSLRVTARSRRPRTAWHRRLLP
jgi:signal peptidase I